MTLTELDDLCAEAEAHPPHFIVLRVPLAMVQTLRVQGERLLVFPATDSGPAVFGEIVGVREEEAQAELALECSELRPWIDRAKAAEHAPLKQQPSPA